MPEISIQDFFTESKAYLVAVNSYQSNSINNLESPIHDVNALKDVLDKFHGFKIETVEIANTNRQNQIFANPLINPTSTQLLNFLSGIKVKESDRVIIYFAGHGIAIDSEGNPEGYLLAADATPGQWATFIKMSDVTEILNSLKCKHLLLVLDCCYAGAFRWANKTRGIGCDIPKTIYFERFKQYANNKAWQVLTSSSHDQKAIDTLRLGKRDINTSSELSPFAQILIDALRYGSADLSYGNTEPDGVITATELGFYLQNKIFEQLFHSGIVGDKQQLPMLFPLIDAGKAQYGKGEFVFINPNQSNGTGIIELRTTTQKNPYKGLDSYSVDDNKIFYGRQRVLKGWIDGRAKNIGLIEATELHNLIVLAGPSGIGKSSLAKAGLLSYYKSTKKLHEIRPGKTPMTSNKDLLEQLKNSSDKEILLVDQYEELVTICSDDKERDHFENMLLTFFDKHLVVVTIRTDFESQFKESVVLKIEKGDTKKYRFVVPPFLREEIEEIVVQPAVQEVLEFKGWGNDAKASDKFIDKIVDNAFQNTGSLPLLSMALSVLYEKKEDNNLLEQVYDQFGGISGILDRKATDEFNSLKGDIETETLFKYLIYRMISFESGRISKRRIYTDINDSSENDELEFDSIEKTKKVKSIANNLVNARLIKPDIDENNKKFIEPSHDALLRSWSMLTEWLKQKNNALNTTTQEEIQLLKSVSDISSRYSAATTSEQQGYLSSWAKHPKLLQVRSQIGDQLNKIEKAFINKAYAQKIRSKRISALAVAIAVALITTGGIIAWIQKDIAVKQTEKAEANLTSFRIASFKERVQNGITYKEANELELAKQQFDSAFSIYTMLENDSQIQKEAVRTDFLEKRNELRLAK